MPRTLTKGHLPWNWVMSSPRATRFAVTMCWQVWSHSCGQVHKRRRRWMAKIGFLSASRGSYRSDTSDGLVGLGLATMQAYEWVSAFQNSNSLVRRSMKTAMPSQSILPNTPIPRLVVSQCANVEWVLAFARTLTHSRNSGSRSPTEAWAVSSSRQSTRTAAIRRGILAYDRANMMCALAMLGQRGRQGVGMGFL